MSTFDFRQFQKAVTRVSPACSLDDTRPVLQTVHIYTHRGVTRFEAADGFRAYFLDADAPIDGQPCNVMLLPSTVKAVIKAKVMRNADSLVSITPQGLILDGKNLGGYETGSTYPDVQVVIPTRCPTFFHVYPVPFLAAVRPAYVFAREGSGVVRLHITESLLVEGQSEETGHSVTEVSIRLCHGPELLIAFNGKFLIDFLKSCPEGAVKMECNKACTPALLTAPDGLRAVLMPMHLCVSKDPIPQRAADLAERAPSGSSYIWPASVPTPGPDWAMARYQRPTGESWDFANYTQPEPGAVNYDLTGAVMVIAEEEIHWKTVKVPAMALIVSNPRPDPLAPLPVDFHVPAYVRPVVNA